MLAIRSGVDPYLRYRQTNLPLIEATTNNITETLTTRAIGTPVVRYVRTEPEGGIKIVRCAPTINLQALCVINYGSQPGGESGGITGRRSLALPR